MVGEQSAALLGATAAGGAAVAGGMGLCFHLCSAFCCVICLGLLSSPFFGYVVYQNSCWDGPRCVWGKDVSFFDICHCRPDKCASGGALDDGNFGGFKNTGEYGGTNWGVWYNWGQIMESCSPWLMPEDEASLRKLLKYAKQKNYKVRPGGASHSAGGIVTELGEDQDRTIVVSLARYKAVEDTDWEFKLNDETDPPSVTVNAGWTQLDLWAQVRPLDLFVPGQTAGYFFQLGGIVANSVHGGAYTEGFIHDLVTRMRVMLWNGTVKIIQDEAELRYWRNSYGLLGIILGVELPLEKRTQFQIYDTERRSFNWTEAEFWKYIKEDGAANIPDDVPSTGGGAGVKGDRTSLAGEFFVEWLSQEKGMAQMIGVCQKRGENATQIDHKTDKRVTASKPSDVTEEYNKLRNDLVDNGHWGSEYSFSEASRANGFTRLQIPAISDVGVQQEVDLHSLLTQVHRVPLVGQLASRYALAPKISAATLTQVPNLIDTLRQKVNDGFFLTNSPIALISAWFLEPEKAFEAMDFLMKEQRASQELGSDKFAWNQPAEFRFVTVKDAAVLQPVPAGFYFNSEFLSFPAFADSSHQWMKAFKKVQDYWVANLSAKPHMGKLFGFADVNGKVHPFADSFTCTVYTQSQKNEFEAYRKQTDPHGLFLAGLGARLLQSCTSSEANTCFGYAGHWAGRTAPRNGGVLAAFLLLFSMLFQFL